MRQHFEICQKFGLQWMEFGIGGGQIGRLPESPNEEDISAFRAMASEFGIQCPFCCLENDFTLPSESEHQAMVAKVVTQMEAAARCGATHVRLFAGFTPAEDVDAAIWERMFAAFETCEAVAQERDLIISIETHGAIAPNPDGSLRHINSLTTDPPSLRRMIEQLPPRIGFNFDPGNIKAVHPDDKSCLLDLLNPRINYCHLKDWKREGDGWTAVAIGDDDLDYGPLFQELKFEGVSLIEYEPLHDPEDGIRRSIDHLRRLEAENSGLSFEF